MSYAAPFNLVSFHASDSADSVETQLTGPLAGSLAIHVVVFIAFLSFRFASSLEPSSGSYEVTLVTLPEIAASPTASSANKSTRNADTVSPPQVEPGEIPKLAPQKKAGNPPSPVPQEKPRVPERVTDSLVGALDSVVLPKPQVLALPQKAAPLLPPPLPPLPVFADSKPAGTQNVDTLPPLPKADDGNAPKPERVTDSLVGALDSVVVPKPQALASPQKVTPRQAPPSPIKQSPAAKMAVQPIQAPPQPPELVIEKSETSAPAPKVGLLAEKLKQRVGTIVVPKKPEQASRRVSPTVTSESKPKQDPTKTPESSGITVPSRAPRLVAVVPLEAPKKEPPLQTAQESDIVESLTQELDKIRIPERITKNKTPHPISEAVPLVPETSPKHPKSVEARNLPQKKFDLPQAPQLAEVTMERDPVPSQSTVPMTTFAPDTLGSQIAKLEVPAVDVQLGFQQTESGAQETLALRVAGPSPKENAYWMRVTAIIKAIWEKKVYRVTFQRTVVLGFRVLPDGQLEKKKGIVVVRSSGNERFDSFAKDAVDKASLPPFPDNMPKPSYDVQYTFTGLPNRQ